jgi:nitroimidazol reductase NimA-like FMN-containing flavoprotein (pyridoxamine 5'-phosphate oxidase superfamily)
MDDDEVAAFLDEQRVVTCATLGRDGWPHLMPLWYVPRERSGDEGGARGRKTIWAWTYAKSQKVRNLERDPRATLQVEAGHDYHELRGVMVKAETRLHRDEDVVTRFGAELTARYAGQGVDPEEFIEVARKQASKRVALEFAETERATWDHRKLGGSY